MTRFISPHMRNHLSKTSVVAELVVLASFIGRPHLRPVRQVAFIDLVQDDRVGVHGLLLKVADVAMARRGHQHIREEVRIEEHSLADCNTKSVQDSWVSKLEEKEQVHALVLCLLQQVMNPAMVTLQRPQAS